MITRIAVAALLIALIFVLIEYAPLPVDPRYLALFGPAVAVYTHSHDHHHDHSGEVIPLAADDGEESGNG